MWSFRNKQLKTCPHGLKSVSCRWYVDDMLVLFFSLDHAEKFKKYLSLRHHNKNFSLEKENYDRSCFLGINIFCEKEKFVTNVYWKKTVSGAFTNFNSFIPENYKTDLIKSLSFWCFSLCSNFVKFHCEINILKVSCIKIVTHLTLPQMYKIIFGQTINVKIFCKYSA